MRYVCNQNGIRFSLKQHLKNLILLLTFQSQSSYIYYFMKFIIAFTLVIIFTSILFPLLIEAQSRTSLVNKLRRRQTSLLGRATSGTRVNYQGLPYSSDREVRFRSDFHKNHFLPSMPYWRMDNEMPGVTRADRFRGNYNGYYYDYYRGRRWRINISIIGIKPLKNSVL